MTTTENEQYLAKQYERFVSEYGKEPKVLRCNQADYMWIEQVCNCDFDTGHDIQYQNAVVVVGEIKAPKFE